jgi:Endosomal/lysosomal potassium channel TMEM175
VRSDIRINTVIQTVPGRNQQPADCPSASNTRIEALSDGVFAIAMTVLVLDLRAPSHREGMLLRGLVAQWPAYVSFLASFLYIGVIRTNHHATFRQIVSAGRSVTWANLGVLCGTVLLPFPTAVLADAFRAGSSADEQTAAILAILRPRRRRTPSGFVRTRCILRSRNPLRLSRASAHRELGSAYEPLGARTEPAARCISAPGDISREFP